MYRSRCAILGHTFPLQHAIHKPPAVSTEFVNEPSPPNETGLRTVRAVLNAGCPRVLCPSPSSLPRIPSTPSLETYWAHLRLRGLPATKGRVQCLHHVTRSWPRLARRITTRFVWVVLCTRTHARSGGRWWWWWHRTTTARS